MRSVLSAFTSLLLLSCGGNISPEAETTVASQEVTSKTDSPAANLAAPPPPCVYFTEATVLAYFDSDVKLPLPGHRSVAEYNSCQYDLEAAGWSAALILEVPDAGPKRQAILDEVAGASSEDEVLIGEAKGRYLNDGRILSVTGRKNFRIKFSALPKAGFEAPFSKVERRELLGQLAAGVLAI